MIDNAITSIERVASYDASYQPIEAGARIGGPMVVIDSQRQPALLSVVFFNGRPAAGVKVINDLVNDPDARPVATAADGMVTLPVRNQGLNVIQAVFNGPTEDAKRYDHIENVATLSFVLASAPE